MASRVRQTASEILLPPVANWYREMVCCSVFLRRPAKTPDRILKSVWSSDNFLLSLILVEFSLLIFGLKTKKEFFMDSGSLPEETIALSTSLRWCPRASQQVRYVK